LRRHSYELVEDKVEGGIFLEQMELLWEYQNLDMKVDDCENRRKTSPLRINLIKLKNYLTNQSDFLTKISEDIDKQERVLLEIQHDHDKFVDLIKNGNASLQSETIQTAEVIEKLRVEAIDIKVKMNVHSNYLIKKISELDLLEKKLNSIRVNISKAKKDYADAKILYDEELVLLQKELNLLKFNRDEVGSKIDASLLRKYIKIKDRRATAVALIENDCCGSCNMMLSAVLVQSLKDKNTMLECDNCGRLLFLTENKS